MREKRHSGEGERLLEAEGESGSEKWRHVREEGEGRGGGRGRTGGTC